MLVAEQTQLWLPCQGFATPGATWHCPSLGLNTPVPLRQSQTKANEVGRWRWLLLACGGAGTSAPCVGPISDATSQVSDDACFHQLAQKLFLPLDVVCPGLGGKGWRSDQWGSLGGC